MLFSESSDISVMVTSCGRFDLLKRTLETFDRFNTAPIRKVFITEDSGDRAVEECIPEHWRPHTVFLVNNPRLGQLRSIDLAYGQIETPWIFHCEDDWDFYREGFIEESQHIERNPMCHLALIQEHIRAVHRQVVMGSHKADWQGFSFNPGLRRRADYLLHAPYAAFSGEKDLSRLYAQENRYALILENDAVLHTGFGEHVVVPEERSNKLRRKRRDRVKLMATLILGMAIGWLLHGI